jgi:hypothetical protein
VVPLSRVIVRLPHCQGVSVLVLDTSTLPAEQRREAWVTAVSSTEVPQLLDVLAWPAAPSHRLSVWPLLPGVHGSPESRLEARTRWSAGSDSGRAYGL